MVKLRIKKDDQVIVLTGKDKGKKGKVIKVLPEDFKVKVEGINLVKRHTRASQLSAGGIIEKEAFLHVSNVALIDPKEGEATRVGYKTLKNGKKVRVAKKSGEEISE